jgi:NAD(P)-dependent dehydrogenase (short-subunit alcohol dehydrogenase family)
MIVTGATNGIGEAAAIELARRGARVGIVARSPSKAEATVARIQAATPGAPVDVFLGDLALMDGVRTVANEILDSYEHIDVLVNNAGIQLTEQRATSEGLPEMVAVNYLAPWMLTALLRERLVASAPARVVVTASEAHRIGWTIDPAAILTDTSPFALGGAMAAYGKSKLLDVLFTMELADHLGGTGVTANCCCPGLVATGLGGTDNVADRVATLLSRTPLIRRPEQGARVLVRLTLDPAFATRSGEFISSTWPDCGPDPAVRCRGSDAASGRRPRRCWPDLNSACRVGGAAGRRYGASEPLRGGATFGSRRRCHTATRRAGRRRCRSRVERRAAEDAVSRTPKRSAINSGCSIRRLPTVAPNRTIEANSVALVEENEMATNATACPQARTEAMPTIGSRVTMRPPARRAMTDIPASAVVARAAVPLSTRSSTSFTSCCIAPTCEPSIRPYATVAVMKKRLWTASVRGTPVGTTAAVCFVTRSPSGRQPRRAGSGRTSHKATGTMPTIQMIPSIGVAAASRLRSTAAAGVNTIPPADNQSTRPTGRRNGVRDTSA